MITDTCCYYYSGDLGLSPLIQHGALHLDRFFFWVFFVLYLFPLLVRSRSGKFLHVGFLLMMQPICASASPTSFLYSRFFFRFGVFQQWVFLSRREGFEQLFLYLFRASSFLVLIFCDDVLRASLYLVSSALY